MRQAIILAGAVGMLAVSGGALASDVALGVKGGTQGLGVELVKGISPSLNLRFDANGFTFDADETYEANDYKLDLKVAMFGALVDWHPFGGAFRMTAGIYSNGTELSGNTTGNVVVNGTAYPGAALNADVDFGNTAPYLGIGWGNAVDQNQRLTFNLSLGVAYTGSADVSLAATGVPVDPNDLRAEEQALQDDIDEYRYYPVANIGMAYRF
jgi:hypothetical protein